MEPDFIVHDAQDTVGVAARSLAAGQDARGWVMETDEEITVPTREAIALGHKLALKDMAANETVIKYGQDMGRTTAAIARGGHVHVHNTKTKRW